MHNLANYVSFRIVNMESIIMSDIMEIKTAFSKESEIDRRVEQLIRKLVASGRKGLTTQDQATLTNLMAQRSRLMRPPMPRIRPDKHAA